jgi:hypothetical protein
MLVARLYNMPKAQQVAGRKKILHLTDGTTWEEFAVKGIREANKICKELNAKPWNF